MILVYKTVLSRLTALAERPPKVRGVTVTRIPSTRPSLKVSWNAVNGSGINYTVCYMMKKEEERNEPLPRQSNCSSSGFTGTSVILYPFVKGTTYYIWVRAVSSDGKKGPFSKRMMETTYNSTVFVAAAYQYCTHVKYKMVRVMVIGTLYCQVFDDDKP